MDRVQCYLLKKTSDVALYLRRFSFVGKGAPCHHTKMIYQGRRRAIIDKGGNLEVWPEQFAKDLYPKQCDCGYTFTQEDQYQVFQDWIYESPFGEVPLREAPPGAMFYADWYPGRPLVVRLPDGSDWGIDHRWTVTGKPPNITAKPSIQTGKWHGFLTEGFLHD